MTPIQLHFWSNSWLPSSKSLQTKHLRKLQFEGPIGGQFGANSLFCAAAKRN